MSIRSLKAQYILFIITVVLTIIITQLIIQYDLNQQNEDARLINIAGRQRMLSQRISKRAMYMQHDIVKGQITAPDLDTLKSLVTRWHNVHMALVNGDITLGLSSRNSKQIDSLLTAISPHLLAMVEACNQMINHPDVATANRTVDTISNHELEFLFTMERMVATYQHEAEEKLKDIKNIELALAMASLAVLLMEFIFIFSPMIRGLKTINVQLIEGNKELTAMNEELQATEEELRSNLDYVTALREKVEEKERQFREVVERATDMIFELDEDGKFSYANPVMESLCGYQREVLREMHYWDLVHPDHRQDVVTFYKQQLSTTTEVSYLEFPIIAKDGSLLWVGQNVRMFFRDNWAFKVSVVARDITSLVQAREALREAKEKAEQATIAKSQFLSMMSHEIRTPMNAIVGITNLLLIEKPRPDQQENLRLLKFSGENLLTIINDILDFNKIEAGKITLEHIDFNLSEFLENLRQVLDQRAREKGISLTLNYNKTAPAVVKGDQVRIGQIMTNLVGNAIKFTEKGNVALEVTSARVDEHRHRLNFSVKDTGIGIEPEKIKRIFESFSQANSDTTRKFGGTGLGLSITKKLLHLMGGEIEVKSTPGTGSEFTFTLVLEEGNIPAPAAAQKFAAVSNNPGRKAKVLLVEDNRVNQIVASNFLRKWGLEVEFANHGKEALELVQNKSYQLILMDLQMPEMDGYEASRRIRHLDHDPYFKKVPIIALTASAMIDIKDKAIQSGMNDFISKPFLPEELQSRVAQYIDTLKPAADDSRKKTFNLDLYTEGDREFKRELATLLIKNLRELQHALVESLRLQDPEIYRKASHKIKPTISMLDKQFLQLVEEIKDLLAGNGSAAFEVKTKDFTHITEKLIGELNDEITNV